MTVYEPSEDSYLLLPFIKRFSRGRVLDMGSGSGILALAASKIADFVVGVDLDPEAVQFASEKAEKAEINNIKFVQSDLFEYFRLDPWLFDLIIFNPPYLPEDKREPEDSQLATTGGKKGYELIEKFLSQASKYLTSDGKILLLFSTLTNQFKVRDIIEDHGFNYQKLAEQDLFQETLFVFLIEKNDFLMRVEEKGVYDLKKFNKGHRGIIYTGKLDKVKIVVKQQRTDVPIVNRIINEARWLKVLNRKGVGPKLLFSEDDYFVYEFVEGEFIIPYLIKANNTNIKKVLTDLLKQCYKLDKLKVIKEEMHHPHKHILISDNVPVMIDFERTHYSETPKNVTQFLQFISSTKVLKILRVKGFKLTKTKVIAAARKYKKKENLENFTAILGLLG